MWKRCKVILLPTRQAENCILITKYNTAEYHKQYFTQDYLSANDIRSHHLYILSDDEIKEDDWMYHKVDSEIIQWDGNDYPEDYGYCKVIASTDSSLKLPLIHQMDIDYYISQYNKKNKIEEVMVGYSDYIQCKGEMKWYASEPDLASNDTIDYYKCNICGDIRRSSAASILSNKRICGKRFDYDALIITKDNTINIKAIKDSWTREEVIFECVRQIILERNYQDRNNGHFVDLDDLNKFVESNL